MVVFMCVSVGVCVFVHIRPPPSTPPHTHAGLCLSSLRVEFGMRCTDKGPGAPPPTPTTCAPQWAHTAESVFW